MTTGGQMSTPTCPQQCADRNIDPRQYAPTALADNADHSRCERRPARMDRPLPSLGQLPAVLH